MASALKEQFDFFRENQSELVEQYNGKFVVIHNLEVFGAYDSEIEALKHASAALPAGSFLIQHVEPGEDAYTQTFYSRVRFG